MNILVCISNVPDTTVRIKLADNGATIDNTGIQWIINPWDELALTRALELRDDPSSGVKQVSVAHVGLVGSEPTIRKALAIGADNAYRVNCNPADAFQTAACLTSIVKNGSFDLVLCGIESSDYNGSNVGGMLAEMLDWVSVSGVSFLKVESGSITVIREIDGGRETLQVQSPCVCVVQKGIAKEPRIAAMRGIMQARTKTIAVSEWNGTESLTTVASYQPPKARPSCKFFDADSPEKLIEALQNEAKVI